MNNFLQIMEERGFTHDCTNLEGLQQKMRQPITAYIGFDCTADALHVGSLVQIMALRWLEKTGHNPIILLGGGTTKVGDPSGKDESRQMLDNAAIEHNKQSIGAIFSQFLQKPNMQDNASWLDNLNYIELLRNVGQHVSINQMLGRDSVKLRLEREQHLSFLEFNYMILQAYDFVELAKRENCILQIGGSDQWGNIVSGIDLGRRMGGYELYGLTTPLITTASGGKMGKTADGTVWLTSEKLSPYDYWQFWRNSEDGDVEKFLKLFTELPLDEITKLAALQGQEINHAKEVLAHEATAMCHGEQAAINAAQTAKDTFTSGGMGDDLPEFAVNVPITIIDLLKETGLCQSNGEARRLIKGGGAKINDKAVNDEALTIAANDFNAGELKLSSGKKRHVKVCLA